MAATLAGGVPKPRSLLHAENRVTEGPFGPTEQIERPRRPLISPAPYLETAPLSLAPESPRGAPKSSRGGT